jgi:hypothetical protein
MSYRLGDPNPVYVNLLGSDNVAGGSLRFYAKGTTTPKATYSDEGLTVANPNPLGIDADGRAENEVWLSGDYTVRLYDGPNGTGNVVWTRDVVAPVPPSLGLPDPTTVPGGTLKSDGTAYELVLVQELPDPTDSPNYMLVVNSDGTGYSLQPQPEAPEPPDPNISYSAKVLRIKMTGGGDDYVRIFGTGTAPASNAKATSIAVTWPIALKSTLHVSATVTTTSVTSSGALVDNSATGWSQGAASSGATFNFNVSDDDTNTSWKITSSVPFSYVVEGFAEPIDD